MLHPDIDLGIAIGRIEADMAEPASDDINVDARFQEMKYLSKWQPPFQGKELEGARITPLARCAGPKETTAGKSTA